MGGVHLMRRLMQRLLVNRGQVRLDVEDDLLHRARERERRLVGVAAVNDPAVVAANVHSCVAREAEWDRVVHMSRRRPVYR